MHMVCTSAMHENLSAIPLHSCEKATLQTKKLAYLVQTK